MKKNKVFLLTIAAIAMFSNSSRSETMDSVLRETYKTNPSIKSAEQLRLKAESKIDEGFGAFLPEVTAQGSMLKTNVKSNNPYSPFIFPKDKYSIDAQQPLFLGGADIYAFKAVKRARDIQDANYKNTVQNTLIDTATAYMNIIKLEGTYELKEKSLELRSEQLKQAKSKFNAGSTTKTDVFTANSQYQAAVAATTQAKGDLDVGREKFKELAGKYPSGDLSIPFLAPINLPQTKEDFLAKVRENNPTILSYKATYEYSKALENTNIGNFLPSIYAGLSYGQSMYDDSALNTTNTTFSLTAKMTLFKGGVNISKYQQAGYSTESDRLQYLNILNKANTEASKVWTEYKTAHENKTAYKEQVKAAEDALKASTIEYRLGKKSIFDSLNAESEFMQASINLLDAQKNEVVLYLQILAAMGELENNIKE